MEAIAPDAARLVAPIVLEAVLVPAHADRALVAEARAHRVRMVARVADLATTGDAPIARS